MILDPLVAHAIALPALLAQAAAPAAGAAQPPAGPGGLLGSPLAMMIPMLIIFWFILIRPQRQKQKAADEMQKALTAGDEIVTIGGAHGVITTLREKTVIVRLVEGKVELDRSAIATRISKAGSAPAAELAESSNGK